MADVADLPQRVSRLETVLETILPHLATKDDLSTMRGNLTGEIGSVRTDLTSVRTEIAQLELRVEGKLTAMERRLTDKIDGMNRWFIGMFVTIVIGFGGLGVKLFS